MRYLIIADSGAKFHMFKEPEFFLSIQPASGSVILGDGQTKLDIKGIGTVKCVVDGHVLLIHYVQFVPDLSESIYSLFQHIKLPKHVLYISSFETGLHMLFPSFQTKAIVGKDDIYLNVLPFSVENIANPPLVSSSMTMEPSPTICRNVTHSPPVVLEGSKSPDNLLKTFRQYNSETKHKQQLGLPVSAGFHQATNLQKMYQSFTSPRKA